MNTINHIVPITTISGLHFCCRLYMSSFSLFDVVAAAESNMLDEMLQNNNGHVAAFNVTDFSTN